MRAFRILPVITERDSDALERYLRDISVHPLLSSEEETELAWRIQQGDKAALDCLVKGNLRFVVSVANQYKGHGLGLADLINEGNVGLITAARRFDPTRGFRFITYAVWWIRQAILLAIISQGRLVRVPESLQELYHRAMRFANSFLQEQERMPTTEEIAEHLHIEPEQAELVMKALGHDVSMDAPIDGEKGLSMLDLLRSSSDNAEEILANKDFHTELAHAIDALPERERDIIRMYFGLNGPELSLEEIGMRIGLGRERTRQLKDKAIDHLRTAQFEQTIKQLYE
ncbi:MAG: RNA polymerase sigma factor RpoD/SigA [Alloprevotella sp.]|nr:RNA polymerase sigma factor RpoD/SigA [Alloprevotella sp.]